MNLWKNLQFTHRLCHRISQHYKCYIYPLKREKKVLGKECKKDGLDSYVVQKRHRRTLQIYDQQYQRCRHN